MKPGGTHAEHLQQVSWALFNGDHIAFRINDSIAATASNGSDGHPLLNANEQPVRVQPLNGCILYLRIFQQPCPGLAGVDQQDMFPHVDTRLAQDIRPLDGGIAFHLNPLDQEPIIQGGQDTGHQYQATEHDTLFHGASGNSDFFSRSGFGLGKIHQLQFLFFFTPGSAFFPSILNFIFFIFFPPPFSLFSSGYFLLGKQIRNFLGPLLLRLLLGGWYRLNP